MDSRAAEKMRRGRERRGGLRVAVPKQEPISKFL